MAALLWLGGMFFLGLVGAPVLRHVEPPELRSMLFTRLGERFRVVGWWAIAVLVLTGLGNLHFRGLLSARALLDPAFWGTRYGVALAWKLAAVVVMLTISALHDFVFGPAAGRVAPGTAEAAAMRRRASWMARANALLGIVLVIAAVRLARGG
ncbi:MAG: DUF4149 domain-containing protein [Gemmatimonadota bacterium]